MPIEVHYKIVQARKMLNTDKIVSKLLNKSFLYEPSILERRSYGKLRIVGQYIHFGWDYLSEENAKSAVENGVIYSPDPNFLYWGELGSDYITDLYAIYIEVWYNDELLLKLDSETNCELSKSRFIEIYGAKKYVTGIKEVEIERTNYESDDGFVLVRDVGDFDRSIELSKPFSINNMKISIEQIVMDGNIIHEFYDLYYSSPGDQYGDERLKISMEDTWSTGPQASVVLKDGREMEVEVAEPTPDLDDE